MARLIGFFAIFAIFLAFIVLNLGEEYKSGVNLGFFSFSEVPVYITAFISLFIGMIFTIPFIVSIKKKKDQPGIKDSHDKPVKKNKKHVDNIDEISGENGPYGIN